MFADPQKNKNAEEVEKKRKKKRKKGVDRSFYFTENKTIIMVIKIKF